MQKLIINDFSQPVRLGCSQEERTFSQEVRFSLALEFRCPPQAESSDNLDHTICYQQICSEIAKAIGHREFALIEKLAATALAAVKNLSQNIQSISLKVHKVNPPIDRLLGGVFYEISEDCE